MDCNILGGLSAMVLWTMWVGTSMLKLNRRHIKWLIKLTCCRVSTSFVLIVFLVARVWSLRILKKPIPWSGILIYVPVSVGSWFHDMESSAFPWQLPRVRLLHKFSGIWQTIFTPEFWIFEIRINFDWRVYQVQWHTTFTPEIWDFWNYCMYSISHGATPLTSSRNFLEICIYESHNISFKISYVNFFF